MKTIRHALDERIAETRRWLGFHKARRQAGYVEALACHIRLQALRDVQAIVDKAIEEGAP